MDMPARGGAPRLSSTDELRERARQQVLDGPVTASYDIDRDRVVDLLEGEPG